MAPTNVVRIFILSVLLSTFISYSGSAVAQPDSIRVCCAWNSNLADGILTFKISGGNDAIKQIIRNAVLDWQTNVPGLTLTEVFGDTKANYEIKFKVGGGMVQGLTVLQFDTNGFIRHAVLNVSGKAFGTPNDDATIAHIAKHETGHALGIGHADFGTDLMSPTVNSFNSISTCDVDAVNAANHWKLVDGSTTPHQPHVDHVNC